MDLSLKPWDEIDFQNVKDSHKIPDAVTIRNI